MTDESRPHDGINDGFRWCLRRKEVIPEAPEKFRVEPEKRKAQSDDVFWDGYGWTVWCYPDPSTDTYYIAVPDPQPRQWWMTDKGLMWVSTVYPHTVSVYIAAVPPGSFFGPWVLGATPIRPAVQQDWNDACPIGGPDDHE